MGLIWLVGSLMLAFAWKLACVCMRRKRSELLANLDPSLDHSHAINASTISLEFPFLFQRALELGVMRTFAIPSISATLSKGGQYAKNASKRYDDTEILVTEMMLHHVDGPRGSLALRRLNFLHSHYAITNADYLYVLCLNIVLPSEWAAIYGYREWTELEKSSNYKVWHDIGTRMGIHDIPPSFSTAAKYIPDFEAQHMVYADSNHEIGEVNMKLLVGEMPVPLQPLVRRLLYSLMDDRLLAALGYPKQPTWLRTLSHTLMKLHGVVVSWMPPRPLTSSRMRISFGCPAITSSDNSKAMGGSEEALLPLAYQRYKPISYPQGYKISEVGAVKSGKLGNAFPGALLCSLQKSNSLPWPAALMPKRQKRA